MIDVLIIEDEVPAIESLMSLLSTYENITVIDCCKSISSAFDLLQDYVPDLVFLDIQLEDGNCFQLLEKLKTITFDIIFITGFDNYALKAFRYNAVDYLLKPIDSSQLNEALLRIRPTNTKFKEQQVRSLITTFKSKHFEKLLLRTQNSTEFITVKDILRIEGDGNYSTVHVINGEKFIASTSIKIFESILDENQFFRSHQSHIINLEFIKRVVKDDGGSIVLTNNDQIPLAKRRKIQFQQFLEKLNFQ